ncbi:nad-dependent epimerase/dehydratase [Thecamonas trahens ATCC 50062]|uniref:Nad-dependent epimerase/dehydratase n=1 Tax=Thecamonas trahens ATCC 50062 TaxID=461836 RepID=A0A0L0DE25_THETB|nr:nad-dependent epimerase/dehydratase [Thecamonas trahens ATCC 50062]KNC50480.1 nad-dependent epimerase/dehydratase [Thecamonas trahens ATCC 50062]|eukprot:XP_013762376.1 nad-dependent epimerase/dehydratase [Thecamonas trahens ATCC 50062]
MNVDGYVARGMVGRPVEDPSVPQRVLVAGGAGFIGSHLAQRLLGEGHFVRVADVVPNEYFAPEEYCSEFVEADLRKVEACRKVCEGMDWIFCLAADMGGMGFIHSNNSVILYNSTMITLSMIEGARQAGAKRFFFASSACVYNEANQEDPNSADLTENLAWPAKPQDGYGLEKLYGEEVCLSYGRDFNMETRIARFHNIYGERGTWKGGREKVPAAFCRKAIASTSTFEMWGDGLQSRSFCHVDDCVEGILRLFYSPFVLPINLGSSEMVNMRQLAQLVMSFEGKDLELDHIPGPEGVRGRNSDNTVIKAVLGWEPQISLADGMRRAYNWIKAQIDAEIEASGELDIETLYATSRVVAQQEPEGDEFAARAE